MTSSGITSGQIAQLTQITESAVRSTILRVINKLNPSKEQIQSAIVENGGDFQSAMMSRLPPVVDEVLRLFLTTGERPDYGHLSKYTPKDITLQIRRLHELFPELGNANYKILAQIEGGELVLPEGAEGFFAIPHWSSIGRSYLGAVGRVIMLLRQLYGGHFQNWIKRQAGSKYLCEGMMKMDAMETLQQAQNADILIIPAQFGVRYSNFCANRVLSGMQQNKEFGFGVYETGIMLLTHPERLQDTSAMRIGCIGDEASSVRSGTSRCIPLFDINGSELGLKRIWSSFASMDHGMVTGFVFPG